MANRRYPWLYRPTDLPPSDVERFRQIIDKVMTQEDWGRLFRRLARSKDPRAAKLLVYYRFGRIDP